MEASLFDARYLRDGREVPVPNTELFAEHWLVRIPGFDELEAHFNGNCLPYVGIYGLDGVRDLVRATLRYPGWAFTMSKIQQLGYNSTTPLDDWLRTPPSPAGSPACRRAATSSPVLRRRSTWT